MSIELTEESLLDLEPGSDLFLSDVLQGLQGSPKTLSCMYFYDLRGSQLFDQICELEEYYLTRTELAIMRAHAEEMAEALKPGVMLVEFGSGSSLKTPLLLDHLPCPAAYAPVDISREHLLSSAKNISQAYGEIEVLPICADFCEDFELPETLCNTTHRAVYFPGSTIGNFEPRQAVNLLERIARICGAGGSLLIGVDLQKDVATLESAYNDAQGITAQFNLNILERINRQLGGDFQVDQFVFHAQYNQPMGRIESFLTSRIEQTVNLDGQSIYFAQGETICTEHSHKYTIDGFARIASEVGLTLRRHWTDPQQRFAVLLLEADGAE